MSTMNGSKLIARLVVLNLVLVCAALVCFRSVSANKILVDGLLEIPNQGSLELNCTRYVHFLAKYFKVFINQMYPTLRVYHYLINRAISVLEGKSDDEAQEAARLVDVCRTVEKFIPLVPYIEHDFEMPTNWLRNYPFDQTIAKRRKLYELSKSIDEKSAQDEISLIYKEIQKDKSELQQAKVKLENHRTKSLSLLTHVKNVYKHQTDTSSYINEIFHKLLLFNPLQDNSLQEIIDLFDTQNKYIDELYVELLPEEVDSINSKEQLLSFLELD